MHFLLDGMLGKLARWLRMMGYEATYTNYSTDADLLTLAKRDSLVLLTSDEELYRIAASRGVDSFLIQDRTETERLAHLAHRFNLSLRIDAATSKCPVCGSALREISKREVEPLVPPTTFKLYQSFWLCENQKCRKVYWHGSHWNKIEQTLESAKMILETKRNVERKDKYSTPHPR